MKCPCYFILDSNEEKRVGLSCEFQVRLDFVTIAPNFIMLLIGKLIAQGSGDPFQSCVCFGRYLSYHPIL